jgi:hypothetical protein
VGNTLRQIRRHWRTPAVVALLAVTALSATIEAGVLLPKFRLSGGGAGGGSTGSSSSYSNAIQNVSLRSWTVTGVHLVDSRSTLELPDVTIVQLSLQRFQFPTLGTGPSRPLHRLTVGPGQTFTVNLVDKQRDCPPTPNFHTEADAARYFSSSANHQHSVPAAFTVATPLGTKTFGTTFTISCSA